MRILVLSDIHSNLEALKAVAGHANNDGIVDSIWCLGDTVGYGPDPRACIEILRTYDCIAVAGNHDQATAGVIGTEDFNPLAGEAAAWTANALTDADREWLASLPETAVQEDFTLVHGSLTDPVWQYLVSAEAAGAHFKLQETPYSLVGHSHLPLVFRQAGTWVVGGALKDGSSIELDGSRFVANPGGVGQPRDGDPRAAYALLDTDAGKLDFHRVEYDFRVTQAKIIKAGLPLFLAERLSDGR